MNAEVEDFENSQFSDQRTVGLLLDPGQLPLFWETITEAASVTIRRAGSDVLLITEGDTDDTGCKIYDMFSEGRIDSVIVFPRLHPELTRDLDENGVPAVFVLGSTDSFVPHVGVDHSSGLRNALNHLKNFGHTELLWTGMPDQIFAPDRYRECISAANELGIKVHLHDVTVKGENGYELIRKTADSIGRYLKRCRYFPTVVIAYNDLAALGAVKAIQEFGLDVPGDVSVIGYDDLYALYSVPALSTVSLNCREIGVRAGETALIITDEEEGDWRGQIIETSFIERESTGPARGESGKKRIHSPADLQV